MSPLMLQVLEDKQLRRKTLAALPFPDKVRIVQRMRDDLVALRRSSVVRRLSDPVDRSQAR